MDRSRIILLIAAYVLWQVFQMLLRATHVLMKGTPPELHLHDVKFIVTPPWLAYDTSRSWNSFRRRAKSHLGANWIRPDHQKWEWRAVVGQWAT